VSERELILAFDELVGPCLDAEPDWDDVIHRSSTADGLETATDGRAVETRRRARFRLSRMRVLVTALILGGLVFIATGFGRDALISLLGRIDIDFGRGKPAPALVRRQFAALSFGLPPQMAPQAISTQARTVTTFRVEGRSHTLWVAPTRSGGFCWIFSHASGGCLGRRELGQRPFLSVSYLGASARSPVPARIEGAVLASSAERLAAEFRDGKTADVPFVFVSKPINAGFFFWGVPKGEQRASASLRAVTARASDGTVIARTVIPLPRRNPPRVPALPKNVKPPAPPSALGIRIPDPTPPFQRGRADGASVTVGRNGAVVFDTAGVHGARRAVLRGSLGVGCFRIEHDQLGIWPRQLLFPRGFGPKIKVRVLGLRHPFDGCEIQAGYGHRWPDRFGSHSAVEIPLTDAGRRYFIDRAAARDLALFVRSMKGSILRRSTGARLGTLLADIQTSDVIRLRSIIDSLGVGKIAYVIDAQRVTYVERSPTGKRFFVQLVNGHIKRQNVKPYAYVY
jgi:hypothetical protein